MAKNKLTIRVGTATKVLDSDMPALEAIARLARSVARFSEGGLEPTRIDFNVEYDRPTTEEFRGVMGGASDSAK